MKMVKGRGSENMKTEIIRNWAGVLLFYLVLIGGVLIIDMRMDSLPDNPTTNISVSK
jgi:hypothetical protein